MSPLRGFTMPLICVSRIMSVLRTWLSSPQALVLFNICNLELGISVSQICNLIFGSNLWYDFGVASFHSLASPPTFWNIAKRKIVFLLVDGNANEGLILLFHQQAEIPYSCITVSCTSIGFTKRMSLHTTSFRRGTRRNLTSNKLTTR